MLSSNQDSAIPKHSLKFKCSLKFNGNSPTYNATVSLLRVSFTCSNETQELYPYKRKLTRIV